MLVFSFQPSLQELTLTLGVNGPLLYRSVIVTFSFGVFSGCLTSREETWRTVTRPTQADSLPVWRWKSVLVFGRARSRLAVQTCSQLSGKLFSFQGQISHFLYRFIKTFFIFMLFTRTVAPAIIFHIVTKKIN